MAKWYLFGLIKAWFLLCFATTMVVMGQVDPDVRVGLQGPGPYEVSPLVINVDGDLSNGLEIISGLGDGSIRAHHADGRLLWRSTLPNHACLKTGNGNKLKSSPAAGDLDGDGNIEIVVGYGGIDLGKCGGGVVALRGIDGSVLWHFDVVKDTRNERFKAVYGTPALGDLDGDGRLEVVFGAHNRMIYALNHRGKKVFSYHTADTVFSSMALADIDKDGALEIVGGTDISQNKAMKIKDGGYLYVFDLQRAASLNKRGTRSVSRRSARQKRRSIKRSPIKSAYGFLDSRAYLWKRHFDQVIQSSPVVADLLPESPGQEIVVGSGCFFPINANVKRGTWLKVVSASSGEVLRTLNVSHCVSSSVAVADLNGDSLLDVVTLVGGKDRSVTAWTPALNRTLWSASIGSQSIGNHTKQAVIADLDGNGSLEVAFGSDNSVLVLAGTSGDLLQTLKVKGVVSSNPVVADINGDRLNDLIAVGGELAIFNSLSFVIDSQPGMFVASLVPYGMWRGDVARTGFIS
jgi:hypothetical protein